MLKNLPKILIFLLFCIIGNKHKKKHKKNKKALPYRYYMTPKKKVTDVRASEYDFSIVIRLPVVPGNNEPINEHTGFFSYTR
jgi:hypothetical protein